MAKPEQPGCGWSRRTLLAGSAALAGGMLAGRSAEARSPAPPTPAAFWGGINQGTGFMPDDPYLSTCIRASDALGLRTVRQGMDTVGGATEGAAFDWRRRDAAFARYRAAGYRIHAVISFRNHVARPSRAQWERNWRYFVRAVMQRYQDQVAIWIIDNEPELAFGDYLPTAAECVTFTRIAWEVLHDLGLEAKCRIESPPVKSLESDFLQGMLEAGLARWCHVIGTHGYGAQIEDHRIRRPWDRLAGLGITGRAVSISECGAIAAWAPAGYPGGGEAWRAIFHRQLRVQAKAFGYEYVLLFDLDRWRQREQEWRMTTINSTGTDHTPIQPVWDAVRDSWGTPRSFANGGFESAESGLGTWMVRHNPDLAAPPELRHVSFPRDAGRARTGSGYCRMDLAGHTTRLVVRQVADGLTPGRRYRVTAYAWLSGGGATLKALGFDRFKGPAERAASTQARGSWTRLSVEVVPSNPWLVVELRSQGTNGSGQEVRWDDVGVTALA